MHIRLNFSCFLLLVFIYFPSGAKAEIVYDALVAKDGSGKFTSIQQAINNAPEGRTIPYKVFIKAGTYTEQQ
jgi:pectin methylesterase-like acyl-CoA thioesterase